MLKSSSKRAEGLGRIGRLQLKRPLAQCSQSRSRTGAEQHPGQEQGSRHQAKPG
jgi:hypothetical protein